MNRGQVAKFEWTPAATDFKLERRAGLSFRMERCFWQRLNEICENERLTPQQFVAKAKREHLGVQTGRAVRFEIADYFYQKFIENDTTRVMYAESATRLKDAMVPVVWTCSGKTKPRAGRQLKVAPFPESKSILDVAAVL